MVVAPGMIFSIKRRRKCHWVFFCVLGEVKVKRGLFVFCRVERARE